MTSVKLLLTSALLLLLAACASVENYQAATRSWIGATKGELLRNYGAPQQTLKDSRGGEMLVYTVDETGTTPVSVTPGRKEIRWEGDRKIITDLPPVVSGGQSWRKHCKTTFFISAKGKVTDVVGTGNNCALTDDQRAAQSRYR